MLPLEYRAPRQFPRMARLPDQAADAIDGRDFHIVVGRYLTDPDFASQLRQDRQATSRKYGYHISPREISKALQYEIEGGFSGPTIAAPSDHYWAVVGRIVTDPGFAKRVTNPQGQSPGATLRKEGYNLTIPELESALTFAPSEPAAGPGVEPSGLRPSKQLEQEMEAMIKFGFQVVKRTLTNAERTYRIIIWMNAIMFVVGILLFIAAAVAGVFLEGQASALFAGLGVVTFVTQFLVAPPEKSQTALANLVQVNCIFMAFQDQISFWEGYASFGDSAAEPEDSSKFVQTASAELQKRTSQTVALISRFVDPARKKDGESLHQAQDKDEGS